MQMAEHLVIEDSIDKLFDDNLFNFHNWEYGVCLWIQLFEPIMLMLDSCFELGLEVVNSILWTEPISQQLHQKLVVLG